MTIFHDFLALIAGFLTMAVLVALITALLVKFAPRFVGETGHPRPAYMAVNVLYSLLASAAGGYVTALISSDVSLKHTLILAIIVLLLSGISAVQQRGRQPIAYQLLLAAISPVGVMLGGLLWMRTQGFL